MCGNGGGGGGGTGTTHRLADSNDHVQPDACSSALNN